MKILYGVQGTGNGHITRAMEIIPYLQQKGEATFSLAEYSLILNCPLKQYYGNPLNNSIMTFQREVFHRKNV